VWAFRSLLPGSGRIARQRPRGLLPGEDGLLEVRYPGCPAVQGHLAELARVNPARFAAIAALPDEERAANLCHLRRRLTRADAVEHAPQV